MATSYWHDRWRVKLEAMDEDLNCGGIGLFIEEVEVHSRGEGVAFRLTF